MTRQNRQDAQDLIISAAVNASLLADERGEPDTAEAIRVLASRLAKQYGLHSVPGLPATFESSAKRL